MTTDLVVLARRRPDAHRLVTSLMAVGPDLRVGAVSEGAALQLFDDEGTLVLTVESPSLIQVAGEAERLLELTTAPPPPYWWIEMRAPATRPAARDTARRLADELAEALDGVVWPPG